MQAEIELTADYERRLAQDVLAGDSQAIEEFNRLLRPSIHGLARLHPGARRPEYAYGDGVDFAVVYLMTGMRQNKGGLTTPQSSPLQKWLAEPKGSLIGFCLVSARNFIVDLSRTKEILTEPLPTEETTDSTPFANYFSPQQEDDLFDKERKRAVQDIYESLPPHDRKILMLKYHSEMTDAEIARELGISETMARNRRNLAEKKFRNLFVSKYGQFV